MSDKRSVATDALETLGTIIDDTAKRDAIHLAVIPAVAENFPHPGQHVEVADGFAVGTAPGNGVGIVDPFLTERIAPGERFWLVLYPRTIQSLRHVWSHIAFPDEPVAGVQIDEPIPPAIATLRKLQSKEASERWLRDFCDGVSGYETVMGAIMSGNGMSDDYLTIYGSDASGEIPPEFWDHVEVVLGRKIDGRPTYFSCSC